MNPPASAALGAEVGNLNTPHRDGTGAVPGDESTGTEVQATQPSAAPTIRQWYGRVKFLEPIVSVWETTAGKARANILRQAKEAGYDVRMPDVQVRLGPKPAYWFELDVKQREPKW